MTLTILRRLVGAILVGIGLGEFSVHRQSIGVIGQPTPGQIRFVLHGVGPFRRAVATATVTRISQTQFSLKIQAGCLGSPVLLHTTFPRHAYVAWLVNGALMQGLMRMAAVGLALYRQTRTYQGQGSVSIGGVTAVVVTAEPSAQAYMPILPLLTVLTSIGPDQR